MNTTIYDPETDHLTRCDDCGETKLGHHVQQWANSVEAQLGDFLGPGPARAEVMSKLTTLTFSYVVWAVRHPEQALYWADVMKRISTHGLESGLRTSSDEEYEEGLEELCATLSRHLRTDLVDIAAGAMDSPERLKEALQALGVLPGDGE